LGKTALLAFASGPLEQFFDQATGLQFVQDPDGFPETLLRKLLDFIFIELTLIDDFQDKRALLVRAVPPLVWETMAIAVAPIAMAVAIGPGEESGVLNVPVHVALQGGEELPALNLDLADVADLLANGKRVLMGRISRQSEFLGIIGFELNHGESPFVETKTPRVHHPGVTIRV
jgi:hypothetical protein